MSYFFTKLIYPHFAKSNWCSLGYKYISTAVANFTLILFNSVLYILQKLSQYRYNSDMNSEQEYNLGHASESHDYLTRGLKNNMEALALKENAKILDLGCGNGFVTQQVANWGYEVMGVDPHPVAIEAAQKNYKGINFELKDSSDKNLKKASFDFIYALEVIEHVYDPFRFLSDCHNLLRPGGMLLLSTPFHGYWKNLALAVTGKMDAHFTVLINNGHIKFFSIPTIEKILVHESFSIKKIDRLGRIPFLAKSMMVLAQKESLAPSQNS